ncbi:MAG: DNA-binding protein Alba [Candidatus Micrarchaeaceae archaeon]
MNETQEENEVREAGGEKKGADNIVYVGKKATMNYVLAVVTQFNGGANEVVIKARGRAISKAVDIKEIAINRFLPNVKTKSIETSSEELTNEDGTKSKVSTIHITLAR